MGTVQTDQTAHLGYRPDIDGMRAIAVIAVLLFHAAPKMMPGGFTGVDAFFVISGYLITNIIVDQIDRSRLSFADFYTRRLRRLFPALIMVLFASLGCGTWLLLPIELTSLVRNTIASAFFSANLMLWSETGYFDIDAKLKPLLHLWSLGIEEQFYLAWPLALWLTPRRLRTILTIATIFGSFALNVALIGAYPEATFYLPFTRIWELLTGGLLVNVSIKNAALRNIALPIFAVAGICFVFIVYHPHTPFPGWAALVPVCVTAAAVLSEGSLLNRFILANPVAVFIGRISYPLYLWHWPMLVYLKLYLFRELEPLESLLALLAAGALASLTYALIEMPVRSGRLGGAKTAVAGMILVVTAAVIAGVNPPRLPDEIAKLIDVPIYTPEWRTHQCFLMRGERLREFSQECVDQKRPLIALWGDSAAASLMPGLRDLQSYYDFGIAEFTASGCQPLLIKSIETDDECLERNRSALTRLSEIRPEVVLLNALWRTTMEELRPTIDALRAIGVRRIIILGKPPIWRGGLPNLVAVYHRRSHELLPKFSSLMVEAASDEDGMRIAGQRLGLAYFSLREAICQNGACETRIGSDLMVSDWLHFTRAGSIHVMRKIAPALMTAAGLSSGKQAP